MAALDLAEYITHRLHHEIPVSCSPFDAGRRGAG